MKIFRFLKVESQELCNDTPMSICSCAPKVTYLISSCGPVTPKAPMLIRLLAYIIRLLCLLSSCGPVTPKAPMLIRLLGSRVPMLLSLLCS